MRNHSYHLLQYMNMGEQSGEQKLSEVRQQQIVRRSRSLRAFAGVLTPEAFAKRKKYLVEPVRMLAGVCNNCRLTTPCCVPLLQLSRVCACVNRMCCSVQGARTEFLLCGRYTSMISRVIACIYAILCSCKLPASSQCPLVDAHMRRYSAAARAG